eukprot:SAG31_NODE_4829_length_2920_cov_211.312655_1_plen_180_part_10
MSQLSCSSDKESSLNPDFVAAFQSSDTSDEDECSAKRGLLNPDFVAAFQSSDSSDEDECSAKRGLLNPDFVAAFQSSDSSDESSDSSNESSTLSVMSRKPFCKEKRPLKRLFTTTQRLQLVEEALSAQAGGRKDYNAVAARHFRPHEHRQVSKNISRWLTTTDRLRSEAKRSQFSMTDRG